MQLFWEENNPTIVYSSKEWKREFGSIYHGSAVMRTRTLGDWVSFTFRGSEIQFMGAQGWDHGSFSVNLDGIETTVDGYCCGPHGGMPQIIQFEANNLNRGTHTVNITNLSAGPRGTVLEVDAFIVTPHASRVTQIREHLPVLFLFMFMMYCLFFIRRRLSKYSVVVETSLPLSASVSASAPVRTPPINPRPRSPPPPPPPRSGKSGYHFLAGDAENDQRAASSSHTQNPPEYSATPPGFEEPGDFRQPGRPYPAPLDYGLVPGVQVNDELVDRIAQRVAGLIHASQSPPQYEGPPGVDR